MKLIELYIENFGRLSGYSLKLDGGLNTVNRENGYGKTTLTVFIKAMLYGLSQNKKQSIFENDRKHYMPWNKGRCGGSLTFEAGGNIWRIERTFMPKAADDTFKLYDERTGKESTAYTERIGEELFGVDEDGFLRTVFLSEENLSGKNDNKSVAAKLSNLVGCDGDISSLGEALRALEDERRVYYKKGGAGEIGEAAARAAGLERRISDLIRLGEEYKKNEQLAAAVTEELLAAEEKRSSLRKRQEEIGRERVRRSYAVQYAEMKKTLAEDEARAAELNEFFKNGAPTASEIEDARQKTSEANALSRQAESTATEPSASRFGDGVSNEEYERARLTLERIRSLDARISALKGEESTEKAVTYLPKTSEIDLAIEKYNHGKRHGAGLHPTLPLSILVFALSAALGYLVHPICYAALAVGAVMLTVGVALTTKRRSAARLSESEASDLVLRYTGTLPKGEALLSMLCELRRMAAESEAKAKRCEELRARLELLISEKESAEREASEFASKFDGICATEAGAMIAEILEKRSVRMALLEKRSAEDRITTDALRRSAELRREVDAFLARFRTTSPRPLDEIAARLAERDALLRSLERTRETVREFGERHGICDGDLELLNTEEPTLDISSENADSEVRRLEGLRAVYLKRCDEILAETAEIDELTAERDAALKKKAEYEKKLEIINKTKDYLARARDNLTSKYLARTKEAFNKYIALIGKDSGDGFVMTTSFEIMKSEGGEYKDSEAYSRGIRDMYALATRLALIDSLYEGESPFVILDDPFAYFDDARLSGAKAVLRALAKEKQIIYLTCSDSRAI